MITLTVKDLPLKKLERELRKKNKDFRRELVTALDKFSVVFVGYAKQNARGMNLAKGLVPHKAELHNLIGGLAASSMAYYAPYVEFGTRGKTKIPSGWEDIARKYEGNYFKSTVSFKESIIDWLKTKLKKNDKEANQLAFPVMMKIMRVGTAPKPFIRPAFEKSQIKLKEYINLAIEKTNRL